MCIANKTLIMVCAFTPQLRSILLACFVVLACTVHASHTPDNLNSPELKPYDFGDAPSSYGSAGAGIDAGVSIGNLIDDEATSQYSQDADGDDDDNIDDEDGVVFLNQNGGCLGDPGTTQQVEVTVYQTVWNDMFLNGWIDFDGNGYFDSDERIIVNAAFYNSGSAQVVTYSYTIPSDAVNGDTYARFRLTNSQTSSPTGIASGNGGEVEDYLVTICGTTNPDPNPGWDYICADGVQVEIVGDGIQGQTSGTVGISNIGTVDSLLVFAIHKNGTPPASVDFSTDNGQNATASPQTVTKAPNGNSCSSCRYYYTKFNPANTVSVNTNGSTNIHSLIVYVFRSVGSNTASTAAIPVNQYFYKGDDSFTVPLPTASGPRDVTIEIPISELNNDTRVAEITASSGGVSVSETVMSYDALLGPSLNIVTIVLPSVPGTATSVQIDVDSPNSGGDSFIVSGYMHVTTDCSTASSTDDYGDAPMSYGDAWHKEKVGLTIGTEFDTESGSQYSTDADGDDNNGSPDDEDGVVFVNQNGTCIGAPGTMQTVDVTVVQSVIFDGFLKGWIDFDGNGTFDSDEVIVDNQAVYQDPNPQLFSFSYTIPATAVTGQLTYARFRYESDHITSPTGYANEGEVEDYVVTICGSSAPSGWNLDCTTGVEVELIGDGIDGQSNASLVIPNSGTVDSIVVVAVSKGGTPPASVTFSSSGGESISAAAQTVTNYGNSCSSCRVYTGRLDPAATVSISGAGSNMQSFVAYVFRTGTAGSSANIAEEVAGYFYKGMNTFNVPVPAENGYRDLTVEIPISELNNDTRVAEITVTAGPVSEFQSYMVYDPGFGPSLEIATIVLRDVPGNITNVQVKIESPNSGGDSFMVGGYISVASDCRDQDYGDAIQSYGDAEHGIVDGLRMGGDVDSESGSQYSLSANGDDNNGIDDEDGVTFLTADQSCFGSAGTNQTLEIDIVNTTGDDAFISAWIDFDNSGTFDASELIIANFKAPDAPGTTTYQFNYTIPANAVPGTTYARFRLSGGLNTDATGDQARGEVEDYVCTIGAAVPVELTQLIAYQRGENVQVEWKTETEIDNKGFFVERSGDGVSWETLGWVDGVGTTFTPQEYTFLDQKPLNGVNYYRLQQLDFNGTFEYSYVVSVEMGEGAARLLVFPNPTEGELAFRVPVDEFQQEEMTLRIFSINGALMREFTQTAATAGTLNIADLAEGTYILEINTGTQQFLAKVTKLK